MLILSATPRVVARLSCDSEEPGQHTVFRRLEYLGDQALAYTDKPEMFLLTLKPGVCFLVGDPVRQLHISDNK